MVANEKLTFVDVGCSVLYHVDVSSISPIDMFLLFDQFHWPNGLKGVTLVYKCETNGVPVTALVGSTTPLVEKLAPEDEEMGYNPFEHRKLSHPTSDMDTLIHLLKGSLGSGILAMPLAFYNSGLLFGVLATFVIGFICTYCVHVLIAEAAFLAGPPAVQRLSGVASATINWFLGIDLLGCCCVYIVFVAKNLKQPQQEGGLGTYMVFVVIVIHVWRSYRPAEQYMETTASQKVVDFYTDDHWDLRIYMVLMMPVLIAINMVRNLKYLAPLSMIANLLIATGLAITFYYIFSDMPALETRPNFSTWHQLPLFFGTAIFALEGIGVVSPSAAMPSVTCLSSSGGIYVYLGDICLLLPAGLKVGDICLLLPAGLEVGYICLLLPAGLEVGDICLLLPAGLEVGDICLLLPAGLEVMPLENNMKTPTHFVGCPGVLNIGMFVVVTLYTSVGFFGYLKYGDETKGSITLNLPTEEVLAQSVKVMIAVAIFFTYALQFYVPMEIIWKAVNHRFGAHKLTAEYIIRVVLVIATVGIAAAIPNLGPFISLVGAVCLSTLGIMFPAIIELVTFWEDPGLGRFNWVLWKNLAIILFGVLGFVTGTYSSIDEIVREFGTNIE
uniref:Amino acid transporter transmembrane domain-containing protein n=1 Tax=Timema cristinae TaxID=61476 RepID=A0A7R9H2K9_TIMCR|nr:unnamed protein product [Timema cristinae]